MAVATLSLLTISKITMDDQENARNISPSSKRTQKEKGPYAQAVSVLRRALPNEEAPPKPGETPRAAKESSPPSHTTSGQTNDTDSATDHDERMPLPELIVAELMGGHRPVTTPLLELDPPSSSKEARHEITRAENRIDLGWEQTSWEVEPPLHEHASERTTSPGTAVNLDHTLDQLAACLNSEDMERLQITLRGILDPVLSGLGDETVRRLAAMQTVLDMQHSQIQALLGHLQDARRTMETLSTRIKDGVRVEVEMQQERVVDDAMQRWLKSLSVLERHLNELMIGWSNVAQDSYRSIKALLRTLQLTERRIETRIKKDRWGRFFAALVGAILGTAISTALLYVAMQMTPPP